jgi:hypothetical protein
MDEQNSTTTPNDFHIYVDDEQHRLTTVLDSEDPQRDELMRAWTVVFNKWKRYREADECQGIGIGG